MSDKPLNLDADPENADWLRGLEWDLLRDAETFLASLVGSGAAPEQQRAMAGRPDVYLASERTGRFFHVSFHDRTYGIRTEATTPGGERERVVPCIRG